MYLNWKSKIDETSLGYVAICERTRIYYTAESETNYGSLVVKKERKKEKRTSSGRTREERPAAVAAGGRGRADEGRADEGRASRRGFKNKYRNEKKQIVI